MNSIWYSLAWKEWHEHKWKLVSMVAILWGAAALAFAFFEPRTDDVFGVAVALVGVCILPLSMFIGLGAAANERSRNTLPFLQSLPAPLWRVAVMKVVFGLVSLFVAIALSIAFIYVWKFVAELAGQETTRAMRQFEESPITGKWYLDCFLLLTPFAIGLFGWSAAAGVNRRDEISAGAMAVAAVVGWGLVLTLAFLAFTHWTMGIDHPYYRDHWRWLPVVAISTLPGGTFPARDIAATNPPISLAFSYIAAASTYALLLLVYVLRFGKVKNPDVRSRQAAVRQSARADWLSAPRQSATTAIVWKQFRESGPIALAGLAGSIGTTLVIVVLDGLDRQQLAAHALGEVYPKVAVVFGFFVAQVGGIGVCLTDGTPRINEFWRSRPIGPDAWFWIKFMTGIVVVLGSVYVPILLLWGFGRPVSESWNTPEAFTIPAMQLALYAAAVATTCLVRQAVYAAILSIAVVYLGVLFGLFVCWLPQLLQAVETKRAFFTEAPPEHLLIGVVTSVLLSTTLAWLAARNDLGKKSRY
jgi:hypothetical protein